MQERMDNDKRRYKMHYKLDPYNEKQFDVVIDTTNLNIDEVAEKVMEAVKNEKVAFSDFDGTLAKGYISMEFMDFLHNKGIYSREAYAKQGALFQEHKTGNVSYDRWVENGRCFGQKD